MEAKFNLLFEPWILALDKYGEVKELPLLDIFRDAHNIKQLAGELPTQDVAVLRLLLAVLYCVFTEYDVGGEPNPLRGDIDGLGRWEELWKLRQFPYEVIESYLMKYKDRFYLFHPERPFYQVANLRNRKAIKYSAAKLIGDLSESGNKVRQFAARSGNKKQYLTYSEAARWLLYLNGFDDTSAKPSERGQDMPSVGAGYLGRLGLIYANGYNLFESLMLNFMLEEKDVEGYAVWETKARSRFLAVLETRYARSIP